MIFKFNCTKNFKDNVCSAMQSTHVDDKAINQDMQWVMHSFQSRRKNCVIAMHVASRYSILFSDINKMNTTAFFELLMVRLYNEMNFLCGLDEVRGQRALKKLGNYAEFHYCHGYSRSVQVHINDVIFHFRDQIDQAGRLPKNNDEMFSSGYFVNRLMRTTVNNPEYFYPAEKMVNFWMRSFIDEEKLSESANDLASDQTNKVVSLFDYKKNKDLI